jgi:hypothetical protein
MTVVSFLEKRYKGSIGNCRGNSRASILPSDKRYSYRKNTGSRVPPTIMGARTCTESHGKVLPPQEVPRIIKPTAAMNKTTPPISRVAKAEKMADHLEPLWKWVPSSSSFRRMKKRRI